MYNWRKLSDAQREHVLNLKKQYYLPWHSPPHRKGDCKRFLITSACYEHKPFIGYSPERMYAFENELCTILQDKSDKFYAWVILPNHYHALIRTSDISIILKEINKFHGRNSYYWNGEENCRGRRVWCNVIETAMKSEKHFQASINYIHHNPVKHSYVKKWQEWCFSSAQDYIMFKGRDTVMENWKKYDISEMGKNWDNY